MFNSTKKQFKIIGYLETVSFVVLMFFSIVVKRMMGHEDSIQIPGMIHGVLFVSYLVLAFKMKWEYNLSLKTLSLLVLASIIPFGPLYVDAKLLKHIYETD